MTNLNKPLISIIMPVNNTEPYLPLCIQSIIDQNYTHWELIAVNDHSTDNSLDVLQQFAKKDKRVKVFSSTEPKLLPALRLGFEKSSGELIQRLDSDDAMPPRKLELLLRAWHSGGRGTLATGKVKYFKDDGPLGEGYLKYEEWMNEVVETETHWPQIYKECVIATGSWLVHRDDFIASEGFNPSNFPEDYDLCFRFYKNGLKVAVVNQVVHLWRDRGDRITRLWKEYADNRFFELKLKHFFEIDRDPSRPLVLWGAGKNGKDVAKIMFLKTDSFYWVCDNDKKIGKDIYGIRMQHYNEVKQLLDPQILIVVSSPDGKLEIQNLLNIWGKKEVKDYWFFS